MPLKSIVFDAYGTLYDTQSVAEVTGEAYPGYGEIITQIWRLKQLEYTWLRSLMRQYEDFEEITRASLRYTLKLLGLTYSPAVFARIMEKYLHLAPFPDAVSALCGLGNWKLAILSNGSPSMLDALVKNTGLSSFLDATISVDEARAYKPSPEAYALVEASLGALPSEVLFVSSNPFDVCGAKAFGFQVAWIERITPEAMAAACTTSDLVSPLTMFRAVRQQMDELGVEPDYRLPNLAGLPGLLSRFSSDSA